MATMLPVWLGPAVALALGACGQRPIAPPAPPTTASAPATPGAAEPDSLEPAPAVTALPAPASAADTAPTALTAPAPAPATEPAPAQAPDPPVVVPGGPMAHIAGGTFRMGDDRSEDTPVHEVRVAAFELDVTEVTVAAYAACVQRGACTPPAASGVYRGRELGPVTACNGDRPDRPTHPVNCVSWEQAVAYCRAAGKRLPTEEEWEYAARGGGGRAYPWGEAKPARQLCWSRGHRRNNTCAVGSFPRDAYGLADMAGNVMEWTASEYQPGDPHRVLRGGNWLDDEPSDVRGAVRMPYVPTGRNEFIGFRCARSLP